jgi:hypothetical protein
MRRSKIFSRTGWSTLRSAVIPVVFTAAILIMIMYGLNQTEISSRAEGMRALEESIYRAVVTCYSVEGRYPPSIAHIEQFYGVHVDRSRFTINYRAVWANVMPEIRILENPRTTR